MSGVEVASLFGLLGLKIHEDEWKKGHEKIAGLKEALIGFAGFEGIKLIGEMIHGVAERAEQAALASKKLGIAATAVQELGYAAKQSGVDQGELEQSLGKLAKNLDEVAQKGSGPAADALQRLGIHASALKGKGLDEDLGILADRFKAMPDGVSKTALAMELFGKSGKAMIPLLDRGKDGIAELREEAIKAGIVIGDETTQKFREFNESTKALDAAWTGIKTTVVTALLPALQGLVTTMREWLAANRETIAAALQAVIEGLSIAFSALGTAVGFVVDVLSELFGFLTSGSDEAIAVLIGIATAIAAVVVPALLAMAAGWVAALWPILLIIAAVAGVVWVVRKLWDKIAALGRGIRDTFKAIAKAIIDALSAAFEFVSNLPVIKQLIWLVQKIAGLANPFSSSKLADPNAKGAPGFSEFDKANKASVKGSKEEAQSKQLQKNLQDKINANGPGTYSVGPKGEEVFTPSVPKASGPTAMNVTNQIGDIHIAVAAAPGMDENALAAKVGSVAKAEIASVFLKIGMDRGVPS